MAARKPRLGRGLGSLIAGGVSVSDKPATPSKSGTVPASKKTGRTGSREGERKPSTADGSSKVQAADPVGDGPDGYVEIAIDRVQPNPYQPRKDFSEERIQELAESIRAEGLLQPIIVRPSKDGYEIVAGERRWRACRTLRIRRIPARVITTADASAAVLALIENLQRENLNPIEEAHGYASLLRDFDLTQDEVAGRVGKSRSGVANALRLLQLDPEIQAFMGRGLISVGHAKVLLGLEDSEQRLLLARRVIEDGLSVRATETIAERMRKPSRSAQEKRGAGSAETTAVRDLEKRISSSLNTPVQLKHTPKRGRMVISYFGNEDLQRILDKLGIRI